MILEEVYVGDCFDCCDVDPGVEPDVGNGDVGNGSVLLVISVLLAHCVSEGGRAA